MKYSTVFGDDALMVLNVGGAFDSTAAAATVETMVQKWSSLDWRGRPRVGGARPEIEQLVARVAKTIDPQGISMGAPGDLSAELQRSVRAQLSPQVAWIVFCAAVATEGYLHSAANRAEYELLTGPFNAGVECRGVSSTKIGEVVTWPRAALLGDPLAMHNLGVLRHSQRRDDGADGALTWLHKACDTGLTEAMFNLGMIQYENGVRNGHDSAEHWWRLAAQGGHAEAMNNLAVSLHDEGFVGGDDGAEHWWLQAAELGHANSMNQLAVLRRGAGRLDGPDGAEYWWRKALDAGRANAAVGLAVVSMDRGDMAQAMVWLQRGAALGDPDARRDLAYWQSQRPPS